MQGSDKKSVKTSNIMGGGGRTLSMSGFKRLSLTSCAILLSLSTVAYAEDIEPAYTLTRVDSKGENTITKFEWDETQNRLVPVYYRVEIKELISDSYDKVYENYTNTPVNVSECSNSSSKYYINPTATYKSVLIENNGDIIGVYFFLLR